MSHIKYQVLIALKKVCFQKYRLLRRFIVVLKGNFKSNLNLAAGKKIMLKAYSKTA